MSPKSLAIVFASLLSLCGGSGFALADTIGRYECTVLESADPAPAGERAGPGLVSYQLTCVGVDGLLKGAVYSAVHVSEWNGQQGKFVMAGGIHRADGGFAVTLMQGGIGFIVTQDGKPIATSSSGMAVFDLGSGTLASLSGKTVKFTSMSLGDGRFALEFED